MRYRLALWAACLVALGWVGPVSAHRVGDEATPVLAQEARDNEGLMMQAIAALLAGLFAGGTGMYFSMRTKRSEAAFDRQLQWCERAVAAFHEAGAAISAAEHARAVDDESAAMCWAAVTDAYQMLIPISGQRVLYATPDGDRAISDFMASFESLIAIRTDSEAEDTADDAGMCLDRLRDAWLAMSVEARKHLALDPLDTNVHQRFTRSFAALGATRPS